MNSIQQTSAIMHSRILLRRNISQPELHQMNIDMLRSQLPSMSHQAAHRAVRTIDNLRSQINASEQH